RLVGGIHFGAERLFRQVEHHREMGRLVLRLHVAQKLPQHVAEAEHGIELQPVRFTVDRRQRVVGAENVAGAVDQEEMVALLQRLGGAWRLLRLWRWFLCGWHYGEYIWFSSHSGSREATIRNP